MNADVIGAQVALYTQELKMPGLRTHFAEIAREARARVNPEVAGRNWTAR